MRSAGLRMEVLYLERIDNYKPTVEDFSSQRSYEAYLLCIEYLDKLDDYSRRADRLVTEYGKVYVLSSYTVSKYRGHVFVEVKDVGSSMSWFPLGDKVDKKNRPILNKKFIKEVFSSFRLYNVTEERF